MKSLRWCIGFAVLLVAHGSVLEAANPKNELRMDPVRQIKQKDFYSQASQDEFVYTILYDVLNKQDGGFYLDIGAGDPIHTNNTYFFEKNLKWKGASIDLNENQWSTVRKNPLLVQDATQSDYASILKSFPRVIDYLSLDVDSAYDVVLEKIPFDDYIFKVITIEHDFYRFGDLYRERERNILSAAGYYLLCPDVSHPACGSFEDWWVHPSAFPPSVFSKLTSLDLTEKDHQEIIRDFKRYDYLQSPL